MIDLEDVQDGLGMRIPVSERVETGAEDHVLPRAAIDRLGQLVFGVAAPRRDERPQGATLGCLKPPWIASKRRRVLGADDPHRDGIVEDEWRVEDLVCGS